MADPGNVERILEKKVQELQALLDFSKAISGLTNAAEILKRLELTLRGQWALRSAGFFLLRDGRPPAILQRGFPKLAEVASMLQQGGSHLESWTAPFSLEDRKPRENDASLLCLLKEAGGKAIVPFLNGETVSGFVVLGERPGKQVFTDEDLLFAEGFVTQAMAVLEAAWRREEIWEWRAFSEARDEWRSLDQLSRLVFVALARLGPVAPDNRETLASRVAKMLTDAGSPTDEARAHVAIARLSERNALSETDGVHLTKTSWLTLPETRKPLAELVRESRRVVSGYRLVERIGAGGMGEVYKAENVQDGSLAAVKILLADRQEDPAMQERFERECEIVASISHPNIVRLLARGEAEGRLFLAMEYVEGQTLLSLRKERPLPLPEAMEALRQIAAALAVLHERGIVHRDVKSSNVMRTPQDRYILLDFGLAKGPGTTSITKTGEVAGTIAYMAPEVLMAEKVTPASDIWALGILFLEILTGSFPWRTDASIGLTVEILNKKPLIPEELSTVAHGALLELLKWMLEGAVEKRLPDGATLVRRLEAIGSGIEYVHLRGTPSQPACDESSVTEQLEVPSKKSVMEAGTKTGAGR